MQKIIHYQSSTEWPSNQTLMRVMSSLPDHRGTSGSYYPPALTVPGDDTSTLAPVGSHKEVEYFFASDARWIIAGK